MKEKLWGERERKALGRKRPDRKGPPKKRRATNRVNAAGNRAPTRQKRRRAAKRPTAEAPRNRTEKPPPATPNPPQRRRKPRNRTRGHKSKRRARAREAGRRDTARKGKPPDRNRDRPRQPPGPAAAGRGGLGCAGQQPARRAGRQLRHPDAGGEEAAGLSARAAALLRRGRRPAGAPGRTATASSA